VLYYWLLFLVFAVGALVSPPNPIAAGAGTVGSTPAKMPFRVFLIVGAAGMVVLIGLRYKVGGDWYPYVYMLQATRGLSFSSALRIADPGYAAVNWLVMQTGSGIWLVNLICGAIFGWGLFRLASTQPSPWLAFAIAIPYMVVVVAMGYTRQAVALGFLMAGLAAQFRGASVLSFAVYVLAASLFHKTAVVAFPLVAISSKGNRIVNLLLGVTATISFYQLFLQDSVDKLVRNYVDTAYASQGAGVRVAMSVVAAVLFWTFRKHMEFSPVESRIWRNFSIASLAAMAALIMSPASTAVDRISLYLLPLQIAVLTRMAMLGTSRLLGTAMVLSYAFAIQYVWLNYAQFASYWVPYQFFPFS